MNGPIESMSVWRLRRKLQLRLIELVQAVEQFPASAWYYAERLAEALSRLEDLKAREAKRADGEKPPPG